MPARFFRYICRTGKTLTVKYFGHFTQHGECTTLILWQSCMLPWRLTGNNIWLTSEHAKLEHSTAHLFLWTDALLGYRKGIKLPGYHNQELSLVLTAIGILRSNIDQLWIQNENEDNTHAQSRITLPIQWSFHKMWATNWSTYTTKVN